jgi:hypothetical protein
MSVEISGGGGLREAPQCAGCREWCPWFFAVVVQAAGGGAPMSESLVSGGVETCKCLLDGLAVGLGRLCGVLGEFDDRTGDVDASDCLAKMSSPTAWRQLNPISVSSACASAGSSGLFDSSSLQRDSESARIGTGWLEAALFCHPWCVMILLMHDFHLAQRLSQHQHQHQHFTQ